jgi:hypothetical protein
MVALRRRHLALLEGRPSSVAHLSLTTQLLESQPAAYIENPAALPLLKLIKSLGRLLLETEVESRHRTLQSRLAAKVQAGRPGPYGWLVTCQNGFQGARAAPSR